LIAELHEELGDLSDVVVTGPALAARAMARSVGRELLDEPRVPARSVVVCETIPPALWRTYLDTGLTEAEARRHFVVVDGPESDLPLVGEGAFSAATLVPVALAGVDVAALLDQAALLAPSLTAGHDDPALALGQALAQAEEVRVLADGTGFEGFAEWAASLLDNAGPGGITVTVGGALPPAGVPGGGERPQVAVNGPLGAQFLCWERAAAVARLLTD
jgi:glucose-6-phosphate isomerase